MARASTHLIHRFENKLESMLDARTAKLDARYAILEARNEALSSRLRFIQWAIGIAVTILATGGAYAVFF